MKAEKRFLVYYNEEQQVIGLREHHFDWEEGQTITTNGMNTVIFGIFEGTDKNLDIMHYMLRYLRSYLPKEKKNKIRSIEDFPMVDGWEEDTVWNIIKEHKKEMMGTCKRYWKSFDTQLDFVDSVFTKME